MEILNHVTGSTKIVQHVRGLSLLFPPHSGLLCHSCESLKDALNLVGFGWMTPVSKRFLLELIVMLYLRGHPLTDIKKLINYAKCKVSVYCSLNIISPSLLKRPQLPISVSSVTQKVCNYPDFFMFMSIF